MLSSEAASSCGWFDYPPYSQGNTGGSGAFEPLYMAACFCKRVQFEVSHDPIAANLCDCSVCMRLHGAPTQWAALFHKTSVRPLPGTIKKKPPVPLQLCVPMQWPAFHPGQQNIAAQLYACVQHAHVCVCVWRRWRWGDAGCFLARACGTDLAHFARARPCLFVTVDALLTLRVAPMQFARALTHAQVRFKAEAQEWLRFYNTQTDTVYSGPSRVLPCKVQHTAHTHCKGERYYNAVQGPAHTTHTL